MKPSDPASDPTLLDSQPQQPVQRPSIPDGYQLGALLGRGGMGEVLVATDEEIGRDVAIKRMRGELGSDAEARFLREARIQARLDHPAIVPVHEIGRDREGRPYFTMKRLTGTTLADILATRTHTQQRLLRAFADVCLAIELAHSRGFVHRDLKPANIMLGDFGEVYVLDWGVARVLAEEEQASIERGPTDSGQTEAGALLGTPGYMAPEQARGEPVGPLADVYSLGAILFEILTSEALHPRGVAAISATLAKPTHVPTERKPDVPPELCAACQAALAANATDRPSARALAERVQRYLDGDRDLARRRALAAEEVERARRALGDDDRATAMQAAGRALALDHESREAAQILTTLTLEPPRKHPPELEAHLAATDLAFGRKQWRPVAYAWMSFWLVVPFMVMFGIEQWQMSIAFYVVVTMIAGFAIYWSRRGTPRVAITMALSVVAAVLLSRFLGPFIILPLVICVIGSGYATYPGVGLATSSLLTIGSFLLALVLEATGLLDPTWELAGSVIVSRSALVDLSGTAGKAMLIGSHVMALAISIAFSSSIARERHDMHRRLEIQAWHLRKLVPSS